METISETKRILCQSIKVKVSSFYEYSGKYMERNRNRKGIGDFEAVTSEKGRQVCGGAGHPPVILMERIMCNQKEYYTKTTW